MSSHITRRQAWTAGAGLLTLAAAGCAPSNRPPASAVLRVGTYKGYDKPLFKAAGETDFPYRVAYSEFTGGNLITEAIQAGAIDFGQMSEIPPIFVADTAPELRLIAVQRSDVNNQVVLVPHDSPIRRTAELKGKRIGYVRATTSHYILLKLLQENGLSFADITPIALSPTDGRVAFDSGRLDAWVIYGPSGYLAREAGGRVLTTGLGRLSGDYVVAASRAAIADPARRACIADYLKRSRRVWNWVNAHPQGYAEAAGRDTGLAPRVYLSQVAEESAPFSLGPVDAAAIASQQRVADAFADAKLIPSRVDVSHLWDSSFAGALT